MNMPQNNSETTKKKIDRAEELKTEGPLSEKDEVKAAELKTAKLHKKASTAKKK